MDSVCSSLLLVGVANAACVVAVAVAASIAVAVVATSAGVACSVTLYRSPLVSGVRASPEPVLRVRLNIGGFGGGESGERRALWDWATVGLGSVAYLTLNASVLGGGVWRRS